MENQVNSKQIIINYGLMLAGASILMSLIQYATGTHLEQSWTVAIIGFALLITVIVLAIKKFKSSNRGYISWGQAVKVGVGVAIISGLIGAVYQYVFMNFIEPDMLNLIAEKQQQTLLDQGYSEEQIEASIEMGKKFQGPGIMAAMSVIGSAIFGFIVSAIAGAIMKKDENSEY